MAFSALFRGLTHHCVDGGGETVIFPVAHQHDYRLVLFRKDIIQNSLAVDENGTHTAPEANPAIKDPNKVSLFVEGKHLAIGGIADTPRVATFDFDYFVPRIAETTKCTTVRPEVTARTPVDGRIAGFFDHPPGTLSVDDFFPNQAVYGNPPKLRCVARTIRLTLQTNAHTVWIGNGQERVVLKPDATVLFINADALGQIGDTNQHFDSYANILGAGCTVNAPIEDKKVNCPRPHAKDDHFPGTDCGGTQGPPP